MRIKRIIIFATVFVATQVNAQERKAFIDSISTNLVYTADVLATTMGGVETGIRYMDNIDVQVLGSSRFFDFFVYGLGNQGGSISELVGDVQVLSNIEADNAWRVHEAWLNMHLKPLKGSLLIGLYDVNSEFDFINTAQLFLNSSHGIGPEFANSGINGPSIFPVTSLAVRFKTHIVPGISFRTAFIDAVPSEPYLTGDVFRRGRSFVHIGNRIQ